MVTKKFMMDKMEGAKRQACLLKAGNNLVLSYISFTDVNTIGYMIHLAGKKQLPAEV